MLQPVGELLTSGQQLNNTGEGRGRVTGNRGLVVADVCARHHQNRKLLGFTENSVKSLAANRARALCHASTFVIHNDVAAGSTLFLALDTIEFAVIGVRHNILLVCENQQFSLSHHHRSVHMGVIPAMTSQSDKG